MGLLELRDTLNPAQFWPDGTSDADTLQVAVAESLGGFVYDGRPTRAFAHARIGNKAVVNARALVTVRLQGIDAPELHFVRPTPATATSPRLHQQDVDILVPDLAGWRRSRMPW